MRALFWRPRNLPRLPRAFSSRTSKDLPHQGSREGGSGAVRGVPGSLSGGSFARNWVRRLGTRLYLFLKRLVNRYFLGELRHQA